MPCTTEPILTGLARPPAWCGPSPTSGRSSRRPPTGRFFGAAVDTAGLHELARFLVGCAVLLLLLSLVDRSLRRVGQPIAAQEKS
jgi:hypothetical protein